MKIMFENWIANTERLRNAALDLIKNIENIYKDSKVVTKLAEGVTEPINYKSGIRQGNSLSPLLFNIVTDEIIKNVRRKKGDFMTPSVT